MDAERTASAADRASDFVFHERSVRPGTRAEIELPIARLPSGTWSVMPVAILHGKTPGPTMWVSGAIHGDELNGVAIVRRLLREIDLTALRGTVIAVPIVNVFAVTGGSRYLPDGRDLNRSFPGSARGSLASRLAHLFFSTVAERCSFGIDFHTGSRGRENLSQIRCDLSDPVTRAAATAFGAPVMIHSNLRDGSIRAAAAKRGIRVLLFESGEAMRFDRRSIEAGVTGALRVLHHIGMIPGGPSAPEADPVGCIGSAWVRAGMSGFAHVQAGLGDRVAAGDPVAYVTQSMSRRETPVRARKPGVVIGVLRTGLVYRGDALVHVAEIEP